MSGMSRTGRTVLAVSAVVLGTAGCGNSDDQPAKKPRSSTQPVPTMREYAAATAKICAQEERRIRSYFPLGSDPTTRHNSRLAIIAIFRDGVDKTRALGYPRGSRHVLEPLERLQYRLLDRLAKDDSLDFEKEFGKALGPYEKTFKKYAPGCSTD